MTLNKKKQNIIFVTKTHSYGIFVAKIYDYARINSFWGSAGILDSPTSYATLGEPGASFPAAGKHLH